MTRVLTRAPSATRVAPSPPSGRFRRDVRAENELTFRDAYTYLVSQCANSQTHDRLCTRDSHRDARFALEPSFSCHRVVRALVILARLTAHDGVL